MSLPQINKLIPCMSDSGILASIKRGATTRREVLSYNLPAAKSRAGRMGGTPSMRNSYPDKSY